MNRPSLCRALLAGALMLGGCGGPVPFSVDALYHPRSNAYEDVRVYAEGMKPPEGVPRRTNVTVVLRTREGVRRVLRVRTAETEPYLAEDVADTVLRRNLPLDADLLRAWLPATEDEIVEEHLRGEAEEILEVVRAAAGGSRNALPATRHLRLVEVR